MVKTAGTKIIYKNGELIHFLDVIINNIELIRNNYYKSNDIDPTTATEDRFPVADYINEVKLAYYLVGDEFMPAWKIDIDNISYYFDAYTGYNYTFYKKQINGDANELE